jgi:type I restriction enzyme, S subunit
MFGDPVINEKGWEMKCVDEIADSRLGKMRDKQFITGNHLKYYLGNSNVKWFSFSFDKMEQMDFDDDEQLKYSLQYGDLLVCEGGEIGKCAIWKCEMNDVYFQKALHRIRVKKDMVNEYYLAYVFYLFALGNGFANVTNGATIAHLTGVKLKKILIPTPPVMLQNQFAEIVTKTEEQKALVNKAVDETQHLFDSLMSKSFE